MTLLGQNVNSYGRDITLAERQAGSDDRVQPLFADLLRAAGMLKAFGGFGMSVRIRKICALMFWKPWQIRQQYVSTCITHCSQVLIAFCL